MRKTDERRRASPPGFTPEQIEPATASALRVVMAPRHPGRIMRLLRTAGIALLVCAPPPAMAADPARGERLFGTRCASCHSVGPFARSAFGPQLNGLYGRRAGSAPDYRYSPAMARSAIVWNDKTLAAFLASPGDVVPGTKMRFWGMSNERQVADLLAYLRSVPPAKAR